MTRKSKLELRYAILSYLNGMTIGWLFWYFVVLDFSFSIETSFTILVVLILAFGIGNCIFLGFRCVCILVWLEIFDKVGISALKAFVFMCVITGPFLNTTLNVKESVRVLQCLTELTFNLTVIKFKLLSEPFGNASNEITESLSQVQDSFEKLKEIIEPITIEIEEPFHETHQPNLTNQRIEEPNTNQQFRAKRFHQDYVLKIHDRCKVELMRASDKCRMAFDNAYDRCFAKLSNIVNYLICWPMKMDSICNVLGASDDIEKMCNTRNVIDSDLGYKYAELKNIEYSLRKENNPLKIEVRPNEMSNLTTDLNRELKAFRNIGAKFEKNINYKNKIVAGFVYVINKILSLIFLRILSRAYSYYHNYLSNIDCDNRFITKYFEDIDVRRWKRGQMHLFPLISIERKTLVYLNSYKIKVNELWFMVPFLLKMMVEITFILFFLLVDHFLYVVLTAIKDNSAMTYHQEGKFDNVLEVYGTGMLAKLIRKALKDMNFKKQITRVTNNDVCLPNPTQLSDWIGFKIFGTYILMILFKLSFAIVRHLRPVLMAKFFPKREKMRILHLYNKCLKQRKRLHKSTSKLLLKKLRSGDHSGTNLFMRTIQICSPYLNWLRIIPCLRRKCWICKERESIGDTNILINSVEFDGYYCKECWNEFKAVFDEIRSERCSTSESGTSIDQSDSDSND